MMYQKQSEKGQPTCGYCGRALGNGFYYMCHICGATYCYAHKPDKCDHRKAVMPPVTVAFGSKE